MCSRVCLYFGTEGFGTEGESTIRQTTIMGNPVGSVDVIKDPAVLPVASTMKSKVLYFYYNLNQDTQVEYEYIASPQT